MLSNSCGSIATSGALFIYKLSADGNGDGHVNAADLSVLLAQFGQSVPAGTGGDANDDGVVNSADLSVLLGSFGQAC